MYFWVACFLCPFGLFVLPHGDQGCERLVLRFLELEGI